MNTMRSTIFAVVLGVGSEHAVAQESGSGVRAFAEAVNAGDPGGCLAAFAPGAEVVDLGRDLSNPDRLAWFCKALVDAGARYDTLSLEESGGTLRWRFVYTADSYRLDGEATVRESRGRLSELQIVPRTGGRESTP